MNLRITKLTESAMRTKSMVGEGGPPIVGFPFCIICSKPLTPGADFRQITTSIVVRVIDTNSGWEIETMNSRYRIDKVH